MKTTVRLNGEILKGHPVNLEKDIFSTTFFYYPTLLLPFHIVQKV